MMKMISATSVARSRQPCAQPRPRPSPLFLDRTRRDLERSGDLRYAEAPEEAQFDDSCLACIELCQLSQRRVECTQVERLCHAVDGNGEGHPFPASAALVGVLPSRSVNEH